MTERLCIRCQHPLTLDEGQLAYCGVCGAPQIFLSGELQEQAALEAQRYSEQKVVAGAAAGTTAAADQPTTRIAGLRRAAGAGYGQWPMAVEYALLSSGIALGLDLIGLAFAPLLFLAWLWVVSAPILTVGFYHAKARGERLTAGFAAKLGLLTGLLVIVGCAVVFTLSLTLSRFVFHSGAIDTQIASAMAQIRSNAQAQYGAASQPLFRLLNVPEFRVGFLLWMCAVTAGIYLVASMAAAGVAGLVLRNRRPA